MSSIRAGDMAADAGEVTSPPSTGSEYHSEAPSMTSSRSVAVSSVTLPVRSGRKGSKKVRTGCITCKIRRVKCDEGKPECQRCVKTGRKCDGYLAGSGTASSSRESHSPAPHRTYSPPRLPSAYPGWDLSEQRAFHFYRTCSSNSLFAPATVSFWGRVVPGLCFQEPAIRHAAMVISDLHERAYHGLDAVAFGSDRPGYPALSAFAAGHYSQAMRALHGWKAPRDGVLAGSASITVPLLACALFICIEFMLGNESVAQLHINQGRQILASFRDDGSSSGHPGVELIRKELVPIFTRLSLASFLFGSAPVPIPAELRWTRTGTDTEDHMVFSSMTDAEQTLNEIMDDALRYTREATMWAYASSQQPGGEVVEAQQQAMRQAEAHHLAQLEKWHVAFAVLRTTSPGADDELAAKMCRLYYLAAFVFVSRAMSNEQTSHDQNTPSFASIVLLAGEIMDHCERRGEQAGQWSRFSFESGVIPPLYLAATRTRHPGLRRAAIAVLRRRAALLSNENLWNAKRIVLIAQRTVQLEEERAVAYGFGMDDAAAAVGGSFAQAAYTHDDWAEALLQPDGGPYHFAGQYPGWNMMMEEEEALPYMLTEVGGACSGEADSPEAEIDRMVRSVPTFMPPNIPREEATRMFEAERAPEEQTGPERLPASGRSRRRSVGLPPPLDLPPWAADGGQGLKPPFNVPERARVKNAVISPQVGGGNWVTFFMTPEPGQGPHWSIIREFIAVE